MRSCVGLMLLTVLLAAQVVRAAAESAPSAPARPLLDLQDRLNDVKVEKAADGGYELIVQTREGDERLTPEQFAERLSASHTDLQRRGWLFSLFNITGWAGVIWVSFGFLAQVLFTGRMIVQWLASEKSRQSVVPVMFWWMSLTGGAMLLVYFIWRKDIVGVLGQSTGVFIYTRNLILIYRAKVKHEPEPKSVSVATESPT